MSFSSLEEMNQVVDLYLPTVLQVAEVAIRHSHRIVAFSERYDGYVHFEDIVAPPTYEAQFADFDLLINSFQITTWYDSQGLAHDGGMTLGEFGTFVSRIPSSLLQKLPVQIIEQDDIYEHKIESVARDCWRDQLAGETKELYEILLSLDPEISGGSLFYSANEMAKSTAFRFEEKKQWLRAGVTIEDDAHMLSRGGLRPDEAERPFKGKTIGYAMLFNEITTEDAHEFLYNCCK